MRELFVRIKGTARRWGQDPKTTVSMMKNCQRSHWLSPVHPIPKRVTPPSAREQVKLGPLEKSSSSSPKLTRGAGQVAESHKRGMTRPAL